MENRPQDDEPLFPENEIVFARFGPRLLATFIDGIIIMVLTVPITYYNVMHWKMPALFILTSLVALIYKPFMEYKYLATLGKMAVGIQVVGHDFQRVTLKEELRRVSFYLVPNLLSEIITLVFYFSENFKSISDFKDYNDYIISANPAMFWLNVIVLGLFTADCLTFLSSPQNRALHDVYADTYVVVKMATI